MPLGRLGCLGYLGYLGCLGFLDHFSYSDYLGHWKDGLKHMVEGFEESGKCDYRGAM